MNSNEMLDIVRKQLAIDLNCTVSDLCGEKDRFIFVEYKENEGRRPFPRGRQHFDMLTMGQSIVVSATPDILDIVKPQLVDKDREFAFSMPFVHGNALYYLPDEKNFKFSEAPKGFEYELAEQEDIFTFYEMDGFHNAIQYDMNHSRPDYLAVIARNKRGEIAGIAGASNDCEKMRQIGVDVISEYRGQGLAEYLVSCLTIEILNRGLVPYYCTAPSNVASQRVAHRVGYFPAWMCIYKGVFPGYDVAPTS